MDTSMKSKEFVNLENARVKEQRKIMEAIKKGEYCPFCPEYYNGAKLEPVIRQGKYWHLRKNRWPYKNTRVHLIIILNQHAENLSEISPEAAQEFFELAQWAEQEYQILGGGLCLRFGDIEINGATVLHLHAHLITAKITDKNDPAYQKVRFKVG